MRNTSLDEFLDADEGTSDEELQDETSDERAGLDAEPNRVDESNGTTAEPDPDAADPDADPVEPATSTFDWTPTGAECADCGVVVERRWRDDVGLVCPDCKTW